jgi:hypothetical protein
METFNDLFRLLQVLAEYEFAKYKKKRKKKNQMSLKARKVFDDHEHFIILHQR